jgi:hypothetical protein
MPRKLVAVIWIVLGLLGACTSRAPDTTPATATPVSTPAAPLPDTGLFIKRLATQDNCQDSAALMRLTIENGEREQLDFKLQRKYTPEQVSTLLTVTAPREESDKALLAVERPEQPTEAYSYLAGLARLARLSSDKMLDFRGTKVTVQELLGMELNQYTTKSVARVGEGGESQIKVELAEKPDRNLAFPRLVAFFRESDQRPIGFELYNARGELAKNVKIEEVKQIQGHQTITRVAIDDHKQNRKLKLETREIKYDQKLADQSFTEQNLIKLVSGASRRLIQK